MSLTAKFEPGAVSLSPNTVTTLILVVHNGESTRESFELVVAGDLADHVTLASKAITLEPGETYDVPVVIQAGANVAAGMHAPMIQVIARSGDFATSASVAVEVLTLAAHEIVLEPARSRGSRSGRHLLTATNLGNAPVTIEIVPDETDGEIAVQVHSPITVAVGEVVESPIVAIPAQKFWNGPSRPHPFTIRTTATNGRSTVVDAIYEQRPRVPAWLGPALVGTFLALLIGLISWFAWIKPWIETTADDAAAQAIELDRIAMEERIAELEAATARAKELPLGSPTDFRLSAAPSGGNSASDSQPIAAGQLLSVTDIVFQNRTGAVGTVTLERDGEVLLESDLANFRDLDLHFVAPFSFGPSSEITLLVDCRTPGPGQTDCVVAASINGFLNTID